MDRPSIDLLERLASHRGIAFRPDRLPRSGWHVASDGARLHYLDWPGRSATLVLVHGGALSAHTFDLLALALGDGVRCIAVDLRGHGLSDWSEAYTVETWASDLNSLIDHLGLEAVHLAGMSLGGCVVGHSALGLGQRLSSLTLIDVGPQVRFAASARMRSFIESVQPAACVEDVVRDALAVSPRTDPDLMLYRYQSLLRKDERWVWRADRRRPVDFPHILAKLSELEVIAPRISAPALIVKGARSQVLAAAEPHRFAARFPNGQSVVIRGAGHNVQEDQPLALARALASTLLSPNRLD